MRRFFIFAIWMLIAPLAALAEETPKKVDLSGVYIFGGPAGIGAEVRILKLDKDKFELICPAVGKISGKVDYQNWNTGDLNFTYFDGKTTNHAMMTYAVEEGHLWLGALRPVEKIEDDKWNTAMVRPELFGYGGMRMPEGTLYWSIKDKTMWVRNVKQPGLRKEFQLPVVRTVDFLIDNPNPKADPLAAFMPVFAESDETKKLNEEFWPDARRTFTIEVGEIHPLGILTSAQGAEKGIDATQAETFVRQIMQGRPVREQLYRRMKHSILTPWSMDLGHVGIAPAKVEFQDAVGQWRSERDKRIVTITEPRKDKPKELQPPLFFGRIDSAAAEGTIAFEPDENGIVVKHYGSMCQAGHADFPGFIVWIQLSPTRAACYVKPDNHSLLKGGMEFFTRAENAKP